MSTVEWNELIKLFVMVAIGVWLMAGSVGGAIGFVVGHLAARYIIRKVGL